MMNKKLNFKKKGFFIMNKQKYIKIDGDLINVNHIVLVNKTMRHFDGAHINIHLSNGYCANILNADNKLYNEIIDFLTNDFSGKNVFNIYKSVSYEKK